MDVLPIRLDRDLPIAIGSHHRGAGRFEALDNLRGRVTESIPASTADERKAWWPRVEQSLRGRRPAPVMRHFQHADAGRRERWDQHALDLGADVASEQDRDLAIDHLEHHGVVVAHAPTFPVGSGRIEYANANG